MIIFLKFLAEKIYSLEIGRYIILRKYFTLKEYLIFLPSLILTEIFTWGYAVLKGYDGIKFKSKAIKMVLRLEVEKMECDRKHLLESLDFKFPDNPLRS